MVYSISNKNNLFYVLYTFPTIFLLLLCIVQGGIDSTNHIEAATSSLSKLGSEMFALQQKLLKQVNENDNDKLNGR